MKLALMNFNLHFHKMFRKLTDVKIIVENESWILNSRLFAKEMEKFVLNLNNKKACDHDMMNTKLLKFLLTPL